MAAKVLLQAELPAAAVLKDGSDPEQCHARQVSQEDRQPPAAASSSEAAAGSPATSSGDGDGAQVDASRPVRQHVHGEAHPLHDGGGLDIFRLKVAFFARCKVVERAVSVKIA